MSYTINLAGLPYISFPSDTPIPDIVKVLEQALIEHPEDELDIVRFVVSYASYVKEKHELCMQAADRLLVLAEDDEDRMNALLGKAGVLWEDRIDLDAAEKLFIEAYNIEAEYQQPYQNLCEIYMERKEYAKALHWANLALQQEGLESIGLKLKGDALLALNRVDEAFETFQSVIEKGTYLAAAYFGMAKCYLDKEQYEPAREACIAAFEKCSYPEPIYAYSIGYCYQHLDDPYRAMKWYCKALDIEPSFTDALNNLAIIHHDLNNGWEEAVPYLLKAVELSNEAINESMKAVYHNLSIYYKLILNHKQASYYSKLMYKCMGLDDGFIDFLGALGDEDD